MDDQGNQSGFISIPPKNYICIYLVKWLDWFAGRGFDMWLRIVVVSYLVGVRMPIKWQPNVGIDAAMCVAICVVVDGWVCVLHLLCVLPLASSSPMSFPFIHHDCNTWLHGLGTCVFTIHVL